MVKIGEIEPAGTVYLTQNQSGDEIPGDNIEDIYADKTAWNQTSVEKGNDDCGECTQTLDLKYAHL